MSSAGYKRTTKKHPARIDHLDGDVSAGAVLVPVGTDFLTTISKTGGFIEFEMENGEETYLSLASIKRITQLPETEEAQNAEANHAKAKADAQRAAGAKAHGGKQSDNADKADKPDKKRKTSPFSSPEQFEALDVLGLGEFATRDEIQSAYRRLVKLYHPDRLRGLGVTQAKIDYAAERLSDINNAYRLLMRVAAEAA